jgi:surface protein
MKTVYLIPFLFLLLLLQSCGKDCRGESESFFLNPFADICGAGDLSLNRSGISPFVSVWATTLSPQLITLPLKAGYNYNFEVDWGDGTPVDTITSFNQAEATHRYAILGIYTITMTGLAEAWSFNNGDERLKIISVTDFGDLGWIDLFGAFYGCSNLTTFAGGNTAAVTNMLRMFNGASSLTNLDLSSFDTSLVTNMSAMFWDTTSLTSLDLSNFDTAKVTNMSYMFANTTNLTSLDLSSFDTTLVTTMDSMFLNTTNLTSLDATGWDVTTSSPTFANIFTNANATLSVTCDQGSLFGETCN